MQVGYGVGAPPELSFQLPLLSHTISPVTLCEVATLILEYLDAPNAPSHMQNRQKQ